MNPVDALMPVVAIAAPAALVLFDVATHDRVRSAPVEQPVEPPVEPAEPAAAVVEPAALPGRLAEVTGAAGAAATAGAVDASAGAVDASAGGAAAAEPMVARPGLLPAPETAGGGVATLTGRRDDANDDPRDRAGEPAYGETSALATAYADSMLSGLTHVETDERSALRRLGALVLLLTLTVLTAALVGAGIYRTVSALR